jgi:light-regulated signal transduction histidine kinase (bacteriophytochrome)
MLTVAKILKEEKIQIFEHWEINVRENYYSASAPTNLFLKPHLPFIIDYLVERFEKEANNPKNGSVRLSWKYDWQGASLIDYDFPQVVREYSAFRLTINRRIQSVSSKDIDRVHQYLDELIMEGVAQFAIARQTQYEDLTTILKRKNQDLERFASVVAHDVRSPLTTVYSFIGLLDEELGEKKSPETQKFLNVVASNTQRLLQMVEKLLEYSTLGQEKVNKGWVNLTQIMRDVLSDLRFLIDETKSQIFIQDLPAIQGDSTLLGLLFQNLIANSIKFRKPNLPAVIRIALFEETADCWTFSLKDEGIGFPTELKETIFEPFKKLHSKDEYKGSGLGLATCRRVVELHGGKIWAESEQGKGSTFYFSLAKNSRS